MIEWVLCLTGRDETSLSARTAYFAVGIFDAFFHCLLENASLESGIIGTNSTPLRERALPLVANSKWTCRDYSVLVGACCLHIASKCEDVSYAGIKDISLSLNDEFVATDISFFISI